MFFLIFISACFALLCKAQQRCLSPKIPTELRANFTEDTVERRGLLDTLLSININTYIHVVTTESKKNNYHKSQIEAQMKVMNDRYKASRIQFQTKSINYIVNDTWASMTTNEEYEAVFPEMAQALHVGSYQDLNLYFLSDFDIALGACDMPLQNPTPDDLVQSGCVISAETMPGGSTTLNSRPYNLGLTTVHETGHWLGLLHTFSEPEVGEPSCDDLGDYIFDTPAQLTATFGCPESQDTCPQKWGKDPVHNYMDYSSDDCLTEFSAGQKVRTWASWVRFWLGR